MPSKSKGVRNAQANLRLSLFAQWIAGIPSKAIVASSPLDWRNTYRALRLEVTRRGLKWRAKVEESDLDCLDGFNYVWDGSRSPDNRRTS